MVPLEGVHNRIRPEYDPIRIRLGSTLWSPTLTTSVIYDDNIFASGQSKRSDAVVRAAPGLAVRTDWPRHLAALSLGAEGFKHAKYEEEDRLNLRGSFSGVLDVRHNANIATEAHLRKITEPRGANGLLAGVDEPIRYRQAEAALFGNAVLGRFYVSAGGRIRGDDYEDTSFASIVFDQDYRDGVRLSGDLRVGFEFTPMTSGFFEYRHNARRFRDADRDSTGDRWLAGVSFQGSRLVSGSVFAGILRQDFRGTAVDDFNSFTFGGNLVWQPTPLLSISVEADRDVDEASIDGVSVDTILSVGASHELKRNLVLSGRYSLQHESYEQPKRTDASNIYAIELRYFANRLLSVSAEYTFTDFNGEIAADYNRNQVGLSVRGQF